MRPDSAPSSVARAVERPRDLLGVDGGHQRGTGRAHHPGALDRATVGAQRQGEPEQHERGGDGGERGEHAALLDAAVERGDQQRGGRGQRRHGEQGESEPGDLDVAVLSRVLADRGHRRMHPGKAPGAEEHDPAEVPAGAEVPVGVQDAELEVEVGHQQPEGAEAEQPGGPRTGRGAGHQPGEHHEQQHVAERVARRDLPGEHRPGVLVHGRPDQEDPGQQRQRGGDDERVDQGDAAAPAALVAHQQPEAGGGHRVEQQRELVGGGGEPGGAERVHAARVVDRVGDREGERGRGQQQPGRALHRPVRDDAADQAAHSYQPDQRPRHGSRRGRDEVQNREDGECAEITPRRPGPSRCRGDRVSWPTVSLVACGRHHNAILLFKTDYSCRPLLHRRACPTRRGPGRRGRCGPRRAHAPVRPATGPAASR